MMGVIEQRRSAFVESSHPFSWVVTDARGSIVGQGGEGAAHVTTWRSAAKPFQLAVSASWLPPKHIAGLTAADLAVGASSHGGQARHVCRVRTLLDRFQRDEQHLYCGAHWPSHDGAAKALGRRGDTPCALHNNCSGKHAFMAAASSARDLPVDYRERSHPLQVAIAASVEAHTGEPLIGHVGDGCGVPCWVVSLGGMARAWARLATATASGDGLLGQIGAAMAKHPVDAGALGQLDTEAMLASRGELVVKIGAEGLVCAAWPARRLGVALKVHSGQSAARAVAFADVMQALAADIWRHDPAASERVVRDVVGRPVGRRVRA